MYLFVIYYEANIIISNNEILLSCLHFIIVKKILFYPFVLMKHLHTK